jgi:hypothetical protein
MRFPSPPRWSVLRSVGNSTAIKLTVLIPVVGYLILFNDYIVQFLDVSSSIFRRQDMLKNASPAQNIPWRLMFLYFGMCHIAAASVLYSWFCPNIIKRFGSAPEYVAQDRDHIPDFGYEFIVSEIQNSIHVDHAKRISEKHIIDSEILGPALANERYKLDVLSLHYIVSDYSRKSIRASTAILYAIGFGIAMVPSIEVFCRALLVLVGAFRSIFAL